MHAFPAIPRRSRQAGTTAIEFALLAMFFFSLVVGIVEVARAMYMWNTVSEITRRYARELAVTNFKDGTATAAARTYAAFGRSDGSFPLSGPINGTHFQVSYLRGDGATAVGALPDCPEQNLINCAADPDGANCIRFVRVRVCDPASSGNCSPVAYPLMVKLDMGLPDLFNFPSFATVVPAAGFGHKPGASNNCS